MVVGVEEPKEVVKKPKGTLGVRHMQVFMLFIAMTIINCIKVTMSIAIVAMTDPNLDNSFDWSHQMQSVILSSFKWGYIFTKVHGGVWSAKYGGKIVIILCIGINSLASLVIPVSASYGGWKLVCACCMVQGIAQGVSFAALHTLISKWVPIAEKSRLSSIIYSGGSFGAATGLLAAGFISDYWGWQGIFYMNGIVGVIWVTFYIFLGASSPQSSKIISAEERLYIQNSLGHVGGHKIIPIPWKALMTSVPFIVLIICHIGGGWGYWTLLTETPTYLNKIHGVNIKANGLISSLPYITHYLMSFVFGYLSDFLLTKRWISVTTARKLSNSIAYYGVAGFLIALSYSSGDLVTAVVLLAIGYSLTAGNMTGFYLVHLDMAPNHAGTMMGITGGISNLFSFGAPLTAGFLIKDENSPDEWRKVFFLAAGIYVVTNTIFLIFGTSKRQKWNEPLTEKISNVSLE